LLIPTGRIESGFLDSLNICKTDGATERDDLTICRQHSFIVTHAKTVERVRREIAAKLPDAIDARKLVAENQNNMIVILKSNLKSCLKKHCLLQKRHGSGCC